MSLQPVPKIAEVLYHYKPLQVETYGPPVPELEQLGRLGYKLHISCFKFLQAAHYHIYMLAYHQVEWQKNNPPGIFLFPENFSGSFLERKESHFVPSRFQEIIKKIIKFVSKNSWFPVKFELRFIIENTPTGQTGKIKCLPLKVECYSPHSCRSVL